MEKIFTPSKWFVLFCAILVLIFGALQMVANMRLQETARFEGERLFSWQWAGLGSSTGTIDHSEIIKKTDTDAIVRVKGIEKVALASANSNEAKAAESVACSAVLTFYRKDSEWMLGKVQFE
ncbi:MAG: hypothetical protein P4L53_11820 [Candidatus Obscuribacterales bacterium]|nr:hypothetical protein [Candidatus Obscuribacterales bacterium]